MSLGFLNLISGFGSDMRKIMNWKTTKMEVGAKLVEPTLYFLFQIGYFQNLWLG